MTRRVTRILLVEDERVTRHRVQKTLEEAGHHVISAANGKEALARLDDEKFDVVLLDIWMPGKSGLDVLEELRTRAVRPRVVVMTADDTPETVLDSIRHEAYHYIAKPVEPDELLRVVASALDAGRDETPPIRVFSAEPHWVEFGIPCDRGAAERIQSFLSRLDADLEPDVREAMGRVFREMLLNAIEWGGGLDPSREVRVTYLRAKRMILYKIADPGKGFRFEEIDHAAVVNPDDPVSHMEAREKKGLRPGGFGIVLSQDLADELLYNEARNEVVFVKYLDAADDG